jgi:hypothetical protein
MTPGDTYHRTLLQACELLGGATELAKRVRRPTDTVVNWVFGRTPVPLEVFLASVDIIVAHGDPEVAASVQFLQQGRKRNQA